MAVIVYLISLLFLSPFLILGLVLAKKFKHPFFYYFKIFIIGLFLYLFLCTIVYVFCLSLGNNREKRMAIIYFENDGLFGCDRFELYSDNEFHIELGDYHYYGTYTLNNNDLELNVNWNPFLPFRDSLPSKLKIIEGKEIIDAETGEVFFQK